MNERATSRDVALAVLRDVFGPSKRGAQQAFAYRIARASLASRDHAFAAELAYGTIKMRRALDWYVRPYIAERTQPLPLAIAEALRMGVYQLRYMDGTREHAAVHETVRAALRVGHRGTAGLVNAVLRRFIADGPPAPARTDFATDDDYLGTRFSVPTWVARQLRERLGERVVEALAGANEAPQLALLVNATRAEPGAVLEELAAQGVTLRPSPFVRDALVANDRPATPLHDDRAGRWWLQGEAACMPADVLDPRPGERVLDLCSGRGNKALQLAARIEASGSLTCVESDPVRVQSLVERASSAGARNVAVVMGDARRYDGERYDAVLLDAPCSGLGVIGRHPEARWRKAPDDGARLSATQSAMLRAAGAATREGGRLVYSVCTTDVRESEDVVEGFLGERAEFARTRAPERYQPFLTAAGDVLVPPGIEGRDGFFISLLERAAAP